MWFLISKLISHHKYIYIYKLFDKIHLYFYIIYFHNLLLIYPVNYLKFKKYYIHNIFTILSQQILSGKLLLTIIDRKKNNFSGGFKLESVTTYPVKFIIKML